MKTVNRFLKVANGVINHQYCVLNLERTETMMKSNMNCNDDLDELQVIPNAIIDDERLIRVVVKTVAREREETEL